MNRGPLILLALAVAAPVPGGPPAAGSGAAGLVEQLGSDDYFEREAATKELAALGAVALPDLRAGCRSPDPEVAARSRELVARIARRAENERTLAPTMVELTADGMPLSSVLSGLSKQSGYDVVIGGAGANEIAAKKVTVATGRVSFWDAVRALGVAADLQIASVGLYAAPRPPEAAERPTKYGSARPHNTVVLEPRAGVVRPWANYGAVCVEAFPVRTEGEITPAPAVLLQVWTEPKFGWKAKSGIGVTRATDDRGQALRRAPIQSALQPNGAGTGSNRLGVFGEGAYWGSSDLEFGDASRQAVVTFQKGREPSARLKEFDGAVFGVIRTPSRAVAAVQLAPGKTATDRLGAATLSATLFVQEATATSVDVSLTYDPHLLQPVSYMDALGGGANSPTLGNHTVHGVRVTDERGNAFSASPSNFTLLRSTVEGRDVTKLTMRMTLVATVPGAGEPKSIEFWSRSDKSVEVPFALRDVSLIGGPK